MWGGVNFAYADDFTVKKPTTFGGTSDAVQDLSGLTDGGTYVLRCNGQRNKYVQVNAQTKRMDFVSNITTEDVASALSVFTLHTSTVDGTTVYSFELGNSGLYLPRGTWNADVAVATAETPETFKIEKYSDGLFYISYTNTGSDATQHPTLYFNGKESTFTMWHEQGGNSQYSFIPVSVGDDVTYRNVTVNVKDGDATLGTFTDYYVVDGQSVSTGIINSKLPFTKYLTLTTTDVVSAANTTLNYTASDLTHAPVDLNEWYTLRTRDDQTHYVLGTPNNNSYVVQGNGSFSSTVQTTYPLFKGSLWRFEKSGVGVKLYNKRVGQYLKSNGETAAATFDATGTAFYFYPASDGRFLLWTGDGTKFLGNHTGWDQTIQANTRLRIYDSYDDHGSWFTAVKADASEDVLAVGKAALEASVTPSDQSLASIEEKAKDAIAALTTQSVANYDNVLATCIYPTLDPNAFYRIKNVNIQPTQTAYISAENIYVGTDGSLRTAHKADNDMDRTVKRTTGNDALIPQLWKFVPQSDGTSYRITNANTNCRMSSYTDEINNDQSKGIDMPIDETAGGDYTFKAIVNVDKFTNNTLNDVSTMFQMICNNHRMNAFGGGGNDNNGNPYQLVRDYTGNHDKDAGSYWQIIKVTSIPVQIRETGWTSVCYPFEVTIPAESKVKAYYAGNPTATALQLTEVANGVIPANTGVFLVNMEGATTVNLEITNDATATLDNNLLSGATAKRTGFAGSDTYLLGLSDNSKSPALLKSTLTWVPANKAYFLASKLANGINVLSLTFGQNTGINEAAANAAKNETYYDLNGRVVLYPQHGIFVTKSSRKVYVK